MEEYRWWAFGPICAIISKMGLIRAILEGASDWRINKPLKMGVNLPSDLLKE